MASYQHLLLVKGRKKRTDAFKHLSLSLLSFISFLVVFVPAVQHKIFHVFFYKYVVETSADISSPTFFFFFSNLKINS